MSYVCEFESLCQPTVDISRTPLPIGCLGRFRETGGDMLKDMARLDRLACVLSSRIEQRDHFSVNIDNIMDTKRTHVGKSAFDRSNTVPVSESYLAPHALRSRLLRPGRRPTVAERACRRRRSAGTPGRA